MRLESTPELHLGPTKSGHYNEVVLLQRWPLSGVSLTEDCMGDRGAICGT